MRIFTEKSEYNRLAKRMQAGDETAASELFEKLADKVFGFCMNRLSRRPEAEDLTQEIFLKLVSNIAQYDAGKGSFLTWFWQLSRNTITDHYRKQKDVSFADLGDGENEFDHPSNFNTLESVDQKMAIAKIRNFLKTLKPEDQEIFELRFVADLSFKEISKILDRPEGTLRVAINRLKIKIKQNFR